MEHLNECLNHSGLLFQDPQLFHVINLPKVSMVVQLLTGQIVLIIVHLNIVIDDLHNLLQNGKFPLDISHHEHIIDSLGPPESPVIQPEKHDQIQTQPMRINLKFPKKR